MLNDSRVVELKGRLASLAGALCPADKIVNERLVKEEIIPINQRLHALIVHLAQGFNLSFFGGVGGQNISLVQP